MKIKMLVVALVSSAACCADASGFDLLDRMLCRSGCGTATSCCGTPVQSNCCGTPAVNTCCDANPSCHTGLLARPLFGGRRTANCGGSVMNDCGGCATNDCGCAQETCHDPCCDTGCGTMNFRSRMGGLFARLRGGNACDSGCGCDMGCDTGCGCDPCASTKVRRPMMFRNNSCNSCDTGCGCNTGCGCDTGCSTPRIGLLDRIRMRRQSCGNSCCDTGCGSGCASGCGQSPVPAGSEQKVEPQPETTTPTTGRYPSAPIVDPNAFIVPKTHYAGQ